MLILVSVALAFIAVVLLVVGFVGVDGLTLIYLSVFCSAAAGVVLYIAVRRPEHGAATGEVDVNGGSPVDLPIADYDALSDEEVVRLLPDLDPSELELVAAHERAGAARARVLDALSDRKD